MKLVISFFVLIIGFSTQVLSQTKNEQIEAKLNQIKIQNQELDDQINQQRKDLEILRYKILKLKESSQNKENINLTQDSLLKKEVEIKQSQAKVVVDEAKNIIVKTKNTEAKIELAEIQARPSNSTLDQTSFDEAKVQKVDQRAKKQIIAKQSTKEVIIPATILSASEATSLVEANFVAKENLNVTKNIQNLQISELQNTLVSEVKDPVPQKGAWVLSNLSLTQRDATKISVSTIQNDSPIRNISLERPIYEPDEKIQSTFTFDVGSRYWYSTTNIKTEGLNNGASYGNPSYVIDWSNMTGSNLELFGKMLHSESEYFVKGYVGTNLGNGASGKMSDVDYARGQTTTSVLNTDAKQLSASYGVLDFGKDFKLSNTSISPFVGYFYWKQKSQSYGGTVGAITSGDYTLYNSLGITVGQVLSNSVNVITYETTVNAPRFGFSLNQPVSEKFTVDFELAYMPFANIKLNDTHNAAPNYYVTNGSPNNVSSGQGWGYGSDIYLKYKVSKNTKFGVGFRYQYFELKNQNYSTNLVNGGWNTTTNGLQKLTLEKFGLMLSGEYRF